MVFDRQGRTLHWHLPAGRSATSIPDSRSLWEILWKNRHDLGGVAHTHPWSGEAAPSRIDLTTWSACERALGVRLLWPIVTLSEVGYFEWEGPRALHYSRVEEPEILVEDLAELRRRSREDEG